MARRSRYLHYQQQVAARLKHSMHPRILSNKNSVHDSVLKKLKTLETKEQTKRAETPIEEGGTDG